MDYEKVNKLVEAGFNAEEIRTMLAEVTKVNTEFSQNNPQNSQNNPQETEKTELSENPAQEKTAENPNIPENAKENSSEKVSELEKTVSNLGNVVNTLVKTIQASNLQNSSFSKPTEIDMEKQVNDIMSSIIRPIRQEGGK